MCPKLKRTLQGQSSKLKKIKCPRKLPVQAGDQAAEGAFGNLASGLRRVNLKGRATGGRAHINVLATAWSLRRPGFVRERKLGNASEGTVKMENWKVGMAIWENQNCDRGTESVDVKNDIFVFWK